MKITRLTPHAIEVNGKRLECPQEIIEIVDLEDRVILLLNPDDYEFGDTNVGRNILCFGDDGEQLWRIADHGVRFKREENDDGRDPNEEVPYAFFALYKWKCKVIASSLDYNYTLDPETGEFTDLEYDRLS